MRTGQAICALSVVLWVAAILLLLRITQDVTYTVCAGTLLQLPPPAVHWPPQGHNLDLLNAQHTVTLLAAGLGIIGAFSVLYASPGMRVLHRTTWLLVAVAGSLMAAALLWLIVEQFVLRANIDALARCL